MTKPLLRLLKHRPVGSQWHYGHWLYQWSKRAGLNHGPTKELWDDFSSNQPVQAAPMEMRHQFLAWLEKKRIEEEKRTHSKRDLPVWSDWEENQERKANIEGDSKFVAAFLYTYGAQNNKHRLANTSPEYQKQVAEHYKRMKSQN